MKNVKVRRNGYFKLRTGGIVFVAAGAFVLVSAWNTGNNLLYVILGMMVSLMAVSVVFCRVTLRGLLVDRSFPLTVHAGRSADLVIRVRNRKREFHSFSLQIDSAGDSGGSTGYVLRVAPGEVATLVTPKTFTQRGLHYLEPTRLWTSYPFGLFEQGVLCNGRQEVLVYPEIRRLKESVVERVLIRGDITSGGGRGSGTDYHGLREYFHGDDARLISWKVSAKQGKLMLREFERPERKGLLLALDTDLGGRDGPGAMSLFEEAVKFGASLAVLCIEQGYDVGLMVEDGSVGFGSGERHSYKILRRLALVEASERTHETLLSELYKLHERDRNTVSVILTPDSRRFGGYARSRHVSVVPFDEIDLG